MIILREGAIFFAFTVMAPLSALVLSFCHWFGQVEAGNDPLKQAKNTRDCKRIAFVYIILWALSSILWYTNTHSQGHDIFLNPLQ